MYLFALLGRFCHSVLKLRNIFKLHIFLKRRSWAWNVITAVLIINLLLLFSSNSFISDIYIAPLQDFYSEALPTTARTLNRSFTPKRMSNCERRTCPGSLRGGLRWIRTCNPPAARHRTYPYTTPPHC